MPNTILILHLIDQPPDEAVGALGGGVDADEVGGGFGGGHTEVSDSSGNVGAVRSRIRKGEEEEERFAEDMGGTEERRGGLES